MRLLFLIYSLFSLLLGEIHSRRFGTPEGIRIPDLPLRRRTLYPAELRGQIRRSCTLKRDNCQPKKVVKPSRILLIFPGKPHILGGAHFGRRCTGAGKSGSYGGLGRSDLHRRGRIAQ